MLGWTPRRVVWVAFAAALPVTCAVIGCGGASPSAAPSSEAPLVRPIIPTPHPRTTEAAPAAEVILAPPGGPAVRVRVEIARTDAERRRGLMFRRHMAPDAGMLFVFDRPERQSFWMRNTYLPLDIVFLGADRRVVGVVEDARPLTQDERAVEAESQYVLEVHAGFAREHGLTVGTPAQLVNVPED